MRTLISAGIGGAGGVFAGAAAAYTPGAYSKLSLASALREWGGDSAGRLVELGKKAAAKSLAAAKTAGSVTVAAGKGFAEGASEELGTGGGGAVLRGEFVADAERATAATTAGAKRAAERAKEALRQGAQTTEAVRVQGAGEIVGVQAGEAAESAEISAATRSRDVAVPPAARATEAAPATEVGAGATRQGVVRQNRVDWRRTRDLWDKTGYSDLLSDENRAHIAAGRTPKVDSDWIRHFPEDAGLRGEDVSMHHIGGGPMTVPLPETRHLDAHLPGGFRYNPGGPGGGTPIYPEGSR